MSARSWILAAFVLGALIFGVWFGEGRPPFFSLPDAPIAQLVLLAVAGALLARTLAGRASAAAGVILAFALGCAVGDAHEARAFNECVDDGEAVRAALAEYQKANRVFPTSLEDLPLEHLPGGLWLRPSLLHYERDGDGYSLEFSDWLVEHRASESEGFTADK